MIKIILIGVIVGSLLVGVFNIEKEGNILLITRIFAAGFVVAILALISLGYFSIKRRFDQIEDKLKSIKKTLKKLKDVA